MRCPICGEEKCTDQYCRDVVLQCKKAIRELAEWEGVFGTNLDVGKFMLFWHAFVDHCQNVKVTTTIKTDGDLWQFDSHIEVE